MKKNVQRTKDATVASESVASILSSLAEAEDGAHSDSDSSYEHVHAGIEEKVADPRQSSSVVHSGTTKNSSDAGATRAEEGTKGAGAGDKLGKRAKRLEKEAKEEKLHKAQALQARIDSEAQRLAQQQQKAHAAVVDPATSSTAAAAGTASSAAASATGRDAAGAESTATVQRCTTCGGAFTDAMQYRQHFR